MLKTIMLVILSLFLLAGCTTQSWYDAFQAQQRRECERYPQQYEVQRCLEKVNNRTYDQYKTQRDELKERQ